MEPRGKRAAAAREQKDEGSGGDTDEIFDSAIKFAVDAHSGAFRKGTKTPYIVHPMEAAAIAATMTDDPEVLAAAVLHDTLEDTDAEYSDLVERFGIRVARLVLDESENKRDDLPAAETWKIRKQETIDALNACTQTDKKILVLSDKLSNMRAISRDYESLGEKLWERFNQHDSSLHGWYYRAIADALSELSDRPAYKEYARLVDKVFGR